MEDYCLCCRKTVFVKATRGVGLITFRCEECGVVLGFDFDDDVCDPPAPHPATPDLTKE
jgi:hypothetical protein